MSQGVKLPAHGGYPIMRSEYGPWVVWSMPVANSVCRDPTGLERFSSYARGRLECLRRNLAERLEAGTANEQVSWLTVRKLTYRDYYSEEIAALEAEEGL